MSRAARVIEDFDDGDVQLQSFPGEDMQPDSWTLDTLITYNNSPYSLKLYGNTWKLESIAPVSVDSGSVWQVAMYVESLGEIQGFGLVTGTETLFYSFAGTEMVDPQTWVPVYQGAFAVGTWNVYQLPVGQDWLARFGHLPTIIGLVFINDWEAGPRGKVYFDEIADVTEDLPIAPQVQAWYTLSEPRDNGDGSWSVTAHFHSLVTDPDSPHHDYLWLFGDDSTGSDSAPVHVYTVRDNHEYTVLLAVEDSTGLWGRDTCRVVVDPGPTMLPVTMNFTGDIMLARHYEDPGGIIDTMGPEGIFQFTKRYLGDAADVTVSNLESPLTTHGTRHPTKPIVFEGRPTNVAGLVYAGIDVVSLANNHSMDYGLEGLQATESVVGANGILYSGAGANSYEAYTPLFLEKKGVNFAFLAASDRNGQYENYQPYLDAGYNKPGFAMLDTFHIREQIRAVNGLADVVIVELHSGQEYSLTPEASGNSQFLIPNDQSVEDEFYSPLPPVPADADTEVRHRVIEAGADLVVCHHPHILQGFEVYQGKLIAHSLGNYAFDMDFPETSPTVILNGKADQSGFYEFWLVPVYIDHYLPMPARGGLGIHILDNMARRSRDLNTYLIVNRDSVTAHIVLDTTTMTRVVNPHSDPVTLAADSGYWVSEPIQLQRHGCISSVVSVTPTRSWQFRVGREITWVGNFEDEGSTLWLLDQSDEYYDTVACQGTRSMCQHRAAGTSTITTNFGSRMVCYSDTTRYTLYGYLKTENAESAGIAVKFYTARTGGSAIGTANLGTVVSGTTGWQFFQKQFVPPGEAAYFDVCLTSKGPQSGDGYAWFDSMGVIEWEDWQPLAGPVAVPEPNDLYWLQVRAGTQTDSAVVSYEETSHDLATAVSSARARMPVAASVSVQPNPAGSRLVVRYGLPRAGRVRLVLYNVLGQTVRVLVDGVRPAGSAAVVWDGRDKTGRAASCGTYFCRLEAGREQRTAKIVLQR
jgi:poly-gamma-glutamate capsule biosynthesis protein CapA/YwtB (metallophosphatase superfamily)